MNPKTLSRGILPQGARPKSQAWRETQSRLFQGVGILASGASLLVLAVLLIQVVGDGLGALSWRFLVNPPSHDAGLAGFMPAIAGSIWICGICAAFAFPVGIGTAILIEEFLSKAKHPVVARITGFVELNLTNLAGVPSIVYGIIGLSVFCEFFELFGTSQHPGLSFGDPLNDWHFIQFPLGRGVLAGGLTLALVALPILIAAAREALRAVPDSQREAALALGSTRMQMVFRSSLPAAIPGIMTGSILALSRAIGEAAPILMIAGIVYIRFPPHSLMDQFTAMPLQIFNWMSLPQSEYHALAAAGIMVLLGVLLSFNTLAVVIRHLSQKGQRRA